MNQMGSLSLKGWKQFRSVEVDFDRSLTFLVGKNGAGKSTILKILAYLIGRDTRFQRTTSTSSENGRPIYLDSVHQPAAERNLPPNEIGSFSVCDLPDSRIPLCIRAINEPLSTIEIPGGKKPVIKGVYICPSRAAQQYQFVQSISSAPPSRERAFSDYAQDMTNGYANSSNFHLYNLKRDLAAFAVHGIGNSVVPAHRESQEIFFGFSELLKELLPEDLRFERIEVRSADIVFITKSGDFNIEALSDGLQSLLSLAWQLFLMCAKDGKYVVAFDEPEAHLHGTLQRDLFPKLVSCFPNVQFVVATHSTTIVSSVKSARVYALMHEDDGLVVSKDITKKLQNVSDEAIKEILSLEKRFAMT